MALLLASVFGVGRAPVASGTAGSFVTALALWAIPFTQTGLVVAFVAVTVVGIWASGRAEHAIGSKDPGVIVIDEVAGMALSVLFLPRTIPVLLAAFFLFRVFDIWKPFPAKTSQDLPGGFGVMVDDLVAGGYTLVLLLAARWALGVP